MDNTNAFKYVNYNNRLKESIAAANRIIENTTITLRLKYLRSVWRSLEMALLNCQEE